ncbi:MAG: restriction endonuclease subunit S [Muribaculaceae bacterium]|nr:restriction endonuclease subunit S [Bacteroidales bacterium]MDY6186324.1 restriction endonuclease subunit S [Muribaculaceae bacterium]
MSKLQELIQRLCPDGVEYKKLGEVIKIYTGEQFNKRDMMSSGQYPVINGGISASGYIDKYNEDQDTITISQGGASAGYVSWQESPFWAGAHCYVIKPLSNETSNRFIYFFLKNSESSLQQMQHGAGIPALNRDKVRNLWFPVLPLEVQEEIVRILDRFSDYAAELQAELQARKEQYEYYRNLLLTFNPAGCAGEADDEQEGSVTTWGEHSYPIQWKTMGEIGKIKMCKRVMKNQTTDRGDIPFYKIGTFGKKADAFISRKIFDEYKRLYSYPRKGTILVSASGTIGRCVVYEGEEAYYQDSNIVWLDNDESIVLNTYLYHYYQIVNWNTEGGTIKRLYNDRFASTPIPIPPLELQEKIVAILDRFETLVNDLSEGLPAEIAAVKEQYEYYRNRLLTFKEKTA